MTSASRRSADPTSEPPPPPHSHSFFTPSSTSIALLPPPPLSSFSSDVRPAGLGHCQGGGGEPHRERTGRGGSPRTGVRVQPRVVSSSAVPQAPAQLLRPGLRQLLREEGAPERCREGVPRPPGGKESEQVRERPTPRLREPGTPPDRGRPRPPRQGRQGPHRRARRLHLQVLAIVLRRGVPPSPPPLPPSPPSSPPPKALSGSSSPP